MLSLVKKIGIYGSHYIKMDMVCFSVLFYLCLLKISFILTKFPSVFKQYFGEVLKPI